MNCVSDIKTNRLMTFKEMFVLYSENYTEQINTLCLQSVASANVEARGACT